MKKKLLVLAAMLILCMALLSACGSAKPDTVNVGALKGPTSMGLVQITDNTDYNFEMFTAPDELTAKVVSGDIDIALLPANVASALYNKTEGNIQVMDVCVLGALYIASQSEISSLSDLEGKTLCLTGKGATPEYAINYLLKENGIKNVKLEFKSEASEVAAVLSQDKNAIGLLPQPFATAAGVPIRIDLTEEWSKASDDSQLITGVAVVNKAFAEEYPDAVAEFLEVHKASTEYTNSNPADAAKKIAELNIVPKAPLAEKAIPMCSITYIDGNEMKESLSGYLEVLYGQNPKAIGGKLPAEDFYLVK